MEGQQQITVQHVGGDWARKRQERGKRGGRWRRAERRGCENGSSEHDPNRRLSASKRNPFPLLPPPTHHQLTPGLWPRRRLLAASQTPLRLPASLEARAVKWRRHLPQRLANRMTNKCQPLSVFFPCIVFQRHFNMPCTKLPKSHLNSH
ncbi:hypothetical protein B0H19DRAFT_1242278 [Mycena capillaripes]|nr:hypothetical protein B0H19DRAFT_1242278 [Mycena capillaripes]